MAQKAKILGVAAVCATAAVVWAISRKSKQQKEESKQPEAHDV